MEGEFVIQLHHTDSGRHWDLMFQQPGSLVTYQLSSPLWELPLGEQWTAPRLADHRERYLRYEGPISNGRGSVSIVDRGRFIGEGDWESGVRLRCHGEQTEGQFEILPAQRPEYRIERMS